MLADFRYALRGFRRSPGFALIAIASLALGIGANTAIFSLVNAVLLRTLPVRDPDRLMMFTLDPPSRFGGNYISATAFRQVQRKNQVFEGFAAFLGPSLQFSTGEFAEDVPGRIASGSFFETLGVNALIGRVLTPDDGRADATPACVIGYGLWTRRFGGDPGVLGRKVLVNGRPFTIVGVTPKQFGGLALYEQTAVTIPLTAAQDRPVEALGRLKRGMSVAQAQASLDVLYHQVETWNRPQQKLADLKVKLEPAGRGDFVLRNKYRSPLLLLMAVVGLVLLIACANVANLLMARASGRTREIAVRLALGSGRARLIRQLLAESLLLTVTGAAFGMALAFWADRALRALAPWQIGTPVPPEVDVSPDWRVLLFTLGVAMLVSVASGLAPAIQSTRPDVTPALKGESGVRAPGRFSFTSVLVVAQVALSLVLLIGAGLFLRSLHNLRSVDPGFDPSQLIVVTIEPQPSGYSPAATQRYFDALVERARRLPGVIGASPALISPLSGDFAMGRVKVAGYVPEPGEVPSIAVNFIGPDYFKTLGTPLVAGRLFTAQDGVGNKVAIVNERAARQYWPQENPIGKRIVTGLRDLLDCEVVGIIKDVKTESLREPAQSMVYLPFPLSTMAHITLHVRVAGNTTPVISALLHEIHDLDPNLPPRNITTMATQIDRTVALDRLLATLTTLFGFLAVILAAVGLYGVMAFAVAARTREIGIRMALGADRGRVLSLVMTESAGLTTIGVALGVPAALWASRAAASQLYGLSPSDPATYFALTALLAGVALSAAWIPARRAAGVDPMVALRYE